ncbi:MAG TPA: hypothetical protein VHG09_03955 [Longimicrobiales bacterium]|nr:hypothetical protein [Longimicrobiales bacterium]
MIEQLGLYLSENADPLAKQIMADWDALGPREPWHRLPPSMDHDHLPDMIAKLAATALITYFGEKERKALAWVAVQHGEHRFELGIAEETVHREYELLRWALWRRLKEKADSTIASQGIIRLDSALSFSHAASLRGYHRRAIEASDDWAAMMDRFITEWSFPSPIQ